MAAATPKRASRESDERLLRMIMARCKGMTYSAIARRLGCSIAMATQSCANVLKADLAESGEDPAAVRRAYW